MDAFNSHPFPTFVRQLYRPDLALLCLCLLCPMAQATCEGLADAEPAKVKFITDGDTLGLTDGRRIRLIGLNAPELYPEAQPLATRSLSRLRELVATDNQRVLIVPGVEPTDRHGRHLAHVMLGNGQLLAAVLINEGLAVQTSVAPNTRCAPYYAQQEQKAREDQRGLWKNDDFWRVSFKRLKAQDRGFKFIQDRVVDVQASTSGTRLRLQHGVIVEIHPSITLLNQAGQLVEPAQLPQQIIEVRGWLFRYRNQHHLKLHHSANFRLLKP